MARPPTAASILRNMKKQTFEPKTEIASEMFIPNHSGISSHPEAKAAFVNKAGDTMTGDLVVENLTINEDLTFSGSITFGGTGQSTISKGLVLNNDKGTDSLHDFRVHGDTVDDLIHTDSSANGVGFYNATPVAKQTGVAVTAAGVHAALVNLGLIT